MSVLVENVYEYVAPGGGGEENPTLSVTVSPGSGLAILLFAAHTNSEGATQGTFARNGQSFTELGMVNSGDFTTLRCWFLRNPTVGTHNITSVTGGLRQGFVALVLTGADQDFDPTTLSENNAQSLDITAVADSLVFDAWVERNADSAVYTQGAGQTLRSSITFADGAGAGEGKLNVSSETGADGTVTMSWSSSGGSPEEGSHIAVVVIAAAVSSSAVPLFMQQNM